MLNVERSSVVVLAAVCVPMSGQAAGKTMRLKHLDHLVVVNVHPVERLTQSGVIGREQPRVLCFDGEMQIAHRPADDGRRVRLFGGAAPKRPRRGPAGA